MKFRILGLLAAGLIVGPLSADASLLGQSVTGTLQFNGGGSNFFDPSNNFVPIGCSNSGPAGTSTVVIGAGTEFCFDDSLNRNVADFTFGSLLISDSFLGAPTGSAPWVMTFTSVTPGLFSSIGLVSDSFVPGLSYGLAGNTITVQWGGIATLPNSVGEYRAEFSIGTNSVPEPGTLALLGLGLAGLGLARRRSEI